MKRALRYAMSTILSISLSLFPSSARHAESAQGPTVNPLQRLSQSQEELAYTLGVQAYIYGYPLVVTAKTMGDMTRSLAPLNQFGYMESLASPAFRAIVTPNSDTLYLNAWLDLSQTPVLLQVPENPENRYYTVQMLDAYTNTFHNESNRLTKGKARQSVIVGPNWKGSLPPNLPTIHAPTNTVWLIGRVEVKGEQDLSKAIAFEKQIQIKALVPGSPRTSPEVPKNALTSLDFYRVMTDVIRKNPPPACDHVLLNQFALAGIDVQSGFDPAKLTPAKLAGLKRALQDAPNIVQNGFPPYATFQNGWGSFSPIGTYGDQFLARAFIAFTGLAANVPEEEAYYRAFTDSKNLPLSGDKAYTLHFEPSEVPKTSAFWSINVYNDQLYLAQTEANRSSVRSNNGTLRLNPDGSLDIAIQKSPPANQQVNWLPVPAGRFNLVLRVFAPEPGTLGPQHTWPAIRENR
ncbi:DUF1254 domain-containing protein [Brevibacillus choshinensis]|uniref:DUF1254 domain-containing protein n=1 Tax=Brevibacillus choshinensis TaxID=54911 RepID=A0ABX7FMQ7_BRECH|nr:DUF1254 domain-containing protein [Brevibacillus choshinensis]QRG67140.1 DUF1254 domain-containing protein [Brevibacillus choshinensis]